MSAGSPRTGRSGGCTATRRCTSAGSGPCCCSRCIRWPWRPWPSTRITAVTRGAGCSGPATSWPSPPSAGPATRTRRSRGSGRCTGTSPGPPPTGSRTQASDPHLLTWVHITEADSFLRAHTQLRQPGPLDQAGRDGYVADMARIGTELGVPDPPRTEAELTDRISGYRRRTGRHRRGARGRPVPAAAAPVPGGRPGPLRRAGGGRGLAAARMGSPAAPAAPAAGDGDRADPPGRARHDPGHPLGHHRTTARSGRLVAK